MSGIGHEHPQKKAILALADGRVFKGYGFGAEGEGVGEVVFNTSMTGYQEILTDPSYCGQLVTMTYPLIGNTGVNDQDVESAKPFLSGFIVKEYTDHPSNWRATGDLDAYLKQHGIVGIQGIDTRALTKHIRDVGAQQGIISTIESDEKRLAKRAAEAPGLIGRDLVKEVSCETSYEWTEGSWRSQALNPKPQISNFKSYKVVTYDFGVKRNILRRLVDAGCSVTVVPARTKAADVLSMNPDGIVLSNGPGDPGAVPYAIESTRSLIGKKPIFGICLGHQILGLAMNGKTYKLKFGHHGGNQPVMDLTTKKVEITAQNHGFAVDVASIGSEMELTHINLNDRTVEGMRHRTLPVFSVQYHPEASPGPHDSSYLFNRFVEMMKNG
ncbi:MAG: glutamine-hydrolyzing carbamoyl-phosphate synthase small subunit [Nitrospirae bacterium]|nr:glutamine-hydrolyzing carbamoyl-phosphate synthase small subunit [Nitrospirota bacterium]